MKRQIQILIVTAILTTLSFGRIGARSIHRPRSRAMEVSPPVALQPMAFII